MQRYAASAAVGPVTGISCALLLCLGLAAFLSGALAQPIDGAQSSTGLNVGTPVKLQIWRTTTLGTYKGVDAYRNAFDAAGIKIGDAADEIIGRPAFPYARVKTEVALAVFSVGELGLEANATSLSGVYKRARQIGLELCPAEVGPRLRLDYRNQPLGDALHIAMEPVATYSGDRTILALTNFGGVVALIGNDGRPEFMVPRTFRFVFALPVEGRLEAVRSPR
jgi:hypothetical protein